MKTYVTVGNWCRGVHWSAKLESLLTEQLDLPPNFFQRIGQGIAYELALHGRDVPSDDPLAALDAIRAAVDTHLPLLKNALQGIDHKLKVFGFEFRFGGPAPRSDAHGGELGMAWVSAGCADVLRYTQQEFLKKSDWGRVVHATHRRLVLDTLRVARNTPGVRRIVEHRVIRQDGTAIWVRTHVVVVRQQTGTFCCRGFSQDISDEPAELAAVMQSLVSGNFQRVIDQLGVVASPAPKNVAPAPLPSPPPSGAYAFRFVYDRPQAGKTEGRIEWITEGVETVLGYTPQEMLEISDWSVLLHPEDVSMLLAKQKQFRHSGKVEQIVSHVNLFHKHGGIVPVRLTIVVDQQDREGRVRHGIIEVLTPPNTAETFGFQVLMPAQDGTTTQIRPLWVGGEVRTVLGYTQEEFLGMEDWAVLVYSEDVQLVARIFQTATLGQKEVFQTRLRCKDGSFKWIRGTFVLMKKNQHFLLEGFVETLPTTWVEAEAALGTEQFQALFESTDTGTGTLH